MSEAVPLPPIEWGAAEDAADLKWRKRRLYCALVACFLALLVLTIAMPPAPRLVWNASASAPRGLYWVSPGAVLARGDTVIAWAPRGARMLAARRRYIPINVPLVKRIAAVAGDRVCARGAVITIGGKVVALRRVHDAAGRPMPWWQGCVTLGPRQFLLLNAAPGSFDGRYFGLTARRDITGRARPLWTWR